MDRYAFMADLVTTAADCVQNPERGCEYDIFVSNGEPPADCSHLAVYWTGATTIPGSEKCLIQMRETFSVSLMLCCLKNIEAEFDPAAEDDDARCFVTDFGNLLECLVCETNRVLANYVRTCQDVVVKVGNPDRSAAGGCMGGTIDISFTRFQPCCPPASSMP